MRKNVVGPHGVPSRSLKFKSKIPLHMCYIYLGCYMPYTTFLFTSIDFQLSTDFSSQFSCLFVCLMGCLVVCLFCFVLFCFIWGFLSSGITKDPFLNKIPMKYHQLFSQNLVHIFSNSPVVTP